MRDMREILKEFGEVEYNKSFREMTTLRIGGNADYVVYPENDVCLDGLMRYLRKNGVAYKVIGKGSDLLCGDGIFHGVVIRLDRFFDDAFFTENTVTAQAGCSIIAVSVQAMKKGLSGLEFASGIPGTVGGAVFMNAGAYKASMSDILKEILVYKDEDLCWMKVEECGFGYRTSVFQAHPDWIILAARMELTPKNREEISALMEDRRSRRMKSQPLDKPSCGSVFRNPEGYNAWALVEAIGYRGKSIGGAMVSDKHCNFIVNTGNATAKDYMSLVREIQGKVKEQFGIELHTEMERFNWDD